MKQTGNEMPSLLNRRWWIGWWIGLLLLCILTACAGEQATVPTPQATDTSAPAATHTTTITPTPATLYNVEIIEPASFPPHTVSFISGEQLWLVAPGGDAAQTTPLGAEDTALAASLTPSPDGSHLAWLALSAAERAQAGAERRNERQLYPVVFDLTTGELRRYPAVVVDRQSGVAWSADSTAVYLKAYHPQAEQQRFLYKLDVAIGETEAIVVADDDDDLLAGDFAFLPSGELLFAMMEPAGQERETGRVLLASLNLASGEVQPFATVMESVRWPKQAWENFHLPFALNPEQSLMALTAGYALDPDMRRLEAQGLYLVSTSGSDPEQVLSEPGLGKPYWSPDGRYVAVGGGIGESSSLWWHEVANGNTTALTEEQFIRIRGLANPDEQPLTYLALSPVAWLDNERLLLQATFAFTTDVATTQRLLLTLDVETGEIGMMG